MEVFLIFPNQLFFNLSHLKIIPGKDQYFFSIVLSNLKAFELTADPFKQIVIFNQKTNPKLNLFQGLSQIEYIITESNFEFFIANISLNNHCDPSLMFKFEWTNFLFKNYIM